MKPTYSIKDWDKHFENHESRKVKRSYWVPIPNRHDGKSYRRIAAHPEGVSIFAAWILILEAASKMPTRGVLADEDGPLDAEDLAAMTGFPALIFESAFNLLTQEKFGWITQTVKRGRSAKSPAASRVLPESPGEAAKVAVEQKGMEGNGTEPNDTEGNGRDSASSEAGASAADEQRQRNFDIWDLGVGKLIATGNAEADARSFLGKMRNDYGDEHLSEAITRMLARNPVEPKAYLVGVLKGKTKPAQKSKVDLSLDSVRQVLEEAQHEH